MSERRETRPAGGSLNGRATKSRDREAGEGTIGSAVRRAAFDEDWRVACPRGHVRLEPAQETETAYCESCERSYGWDALVDRKAASASG